MRSAMKAHRVGERRAARNRPVRTALRTFVKKARQGIVGIGADGADAATALVAAAAKELDQAASKGIIHKNQAARRKSRLMHQMAVAAKAAVVAAETGAEPAARPTRRRTAAATATAAKPPAAPRPGPITRAPPQSADAGGHPRGAWPVAVAGESGRTGPAHRGRWRSSRGYRPGQAQPRRTFSASGLPPTPPRRLYNLSLLG